jgi:phospholipase C
MFINYDEWGGFFDHVRPRFVPDDRENRANVNESWGMTGFRVPGVALSPYTRGGGVSHFPVTHESILKLISYKFGLGHLNKRHRYATNIGRSFRWKRKNMEPPTLPDPAAIAAVPCSLGGSARGADGMSARPKEHDMVQLETSGLLDNLGYEVRDAGYDQIFREPDSVRRAMRDSTG